MLTFSISPLPTNLPIYISIYCFKRDTLYRETNENERTIEKGKGGKETGAEERKMCEEMKERAA